LLNVANNIEFKEYNQKWWPEPKINRFMHLR